MKARRHAKALIRGGGTVKRACCPPPPHTVKGTQAESYATLRMLSMLPTIES